jgi:hypothetical protein
MSAEPDARRRLFTAGWQAGELYHLLSHMFSHNRKFWPSIADSKNNPCAERREPIQN